MRGIVAQGLRGAGALETTADSPGARRMKDSTRQQLGRPNVTDFGLAALAVRTEIGRALRLHDAADRGAAHAARLALAVVHPRLMLEGAAHAVRIAEIAQGGAAERQCLSQRRAQRIEQLRPAREAHAVAARAGGDA